MSAGDVDVTQRGDLDQLKGNAVGMYSILFICVTGSAPLAVFVYNSAAGGDALQSMGAGAHADDVKIPSWFLRRTDGLNMVAWANANPTATIKALEVLVGSAATRRIAVIGEMLELGDRSTELHEGVGRAAAAAGVDVLLAVGAAPARALADAAAGAGMATADVRYFPTSDEAADAAAALVTRGDLVLVKGSRGVKTDLVVDRLKTKAGQG